MRNTIKLLPLLFLLLAAACGTSTRRTSSGSHGAHQPESFVPSTGTGKPTGQNSIE